MQQMLDNHWWQNARFAGVMRYHWKALGKTILWVLGIMLGAQLISLAFPLLSGEAYPYSGVFVDIGTAMIVALVCSTVVAGKSTRFLLRFGTSRFSVWLGNVLSLWLGMAAFLLGTLLLSLLMGGLVSLLAKALPQQFIVQTYFGDAQGYALFNSSLSEALSSLPRYLLYTLEWTAIFYLLGTCLRRNKVATLMVIIGVPMLVMILTLIPAVRHAARVMENANDREMMLLGVQWLSYLTSIVHFVQHEWKTLQLVAAVVSLPLSYLCMRNTPQP